jgi:hypothetical protein
VLAAIVTAAIALLIGFNLSLTLPKDAPPTTSLFIVPARTNTTAKIIADDLLLKYSGSDRVDFHVVSTQEIAIFVQSTAIQVPTTGGWKIISDEQRNEVWRLKPGVVHQVCVERPRAEGWRLYIKYASEMHGSARLHANVHQAWITRSLTNWNGKAWGGGYFGGSNELVSEQIFSE